MSELDVDSGFGDLEERPRRRNLEKKAAAVDHNSVFNLVVKALNVLSAALLTIAIWYMQDLKAEVKETRNDVRAAVTAINKVESASNEHNVRLRAVENVQRDADNLTRDLDRRMTTAESDIKHLQRRP